MDKTKEYTFDDWLNDDITNKEIQVKFLRNRNSVKGWDKIRDAQKEAWNMALEMSIEAQKRIIRDNKDWLKLEIKKINRWIDDRPELEQKFITGQIQGAYITGKAYQRIRVRYDEFKEGKRSSAIIEEKSGNQHRVSELFEMYIYKNYLPELENCLVELTGINSENDIKPTDKRDWLEKEYKDRRQNFNTDDDWAENTAIKFQQEFSTKDKPSPSSMKRYGIYKGMN